MKTLAVYCREALEAGIDGAKVIDPRSIVTTEWVRMKCQFGCNRFGMSLCCPPRTPTPDLTQKIIDSYQKAIFLHKRLERGGRSQRREMVKMFNETTVRLEIEIFLDGYYKAWSMGSGPCRVCKECDAKGLCRHGDKARPSMEACGIDVFKTVRDNGFHIEVVRSYEEESNIFGLVLVE